MPSQTRSPSGPPGATDPAPEASDPAPEPHALFAYGTLLVPQIMEAVMGRVPTSRAAELPGFVCRLMRHEVYPGIRALPGGCVSGRVFAELSDAELERLDRYEGQAYERLLCALADGSRAWTYVVRGPWLSKLSDEPWDLEVFRERHAPHFGVHWR